jgi:hypothetical protein
MDSAAVRSSSVGRHVRGHDDHEPPTLGQSLGRVILGVHWPDF